MENHKQCVEICLPLDLVGDILARLPVKSLIRFCCVCKPWRFLVNDANFAKGQHIRASPALICPYDMPGGRITFYSFDGPECDIKERIPHLELKELAACPTVSNPVNGLMCGYDYFSIYHQTYCLFNPSTRALIQVPGLDPCLVIGLGFNVGSRVSLGLGFDVSTGNYKLVLLSYSPVLSKVCPCFVLTVGCDNKWRYVGDALPLLPLREPVFVEGLINWIARLSEKGEKVVLAFDIKEETFQVIPTPKSKLLAYGVHLSNYDEHLLLTGSSGECLSIWKLDDYTSQKWTREYQIDFPLRVSTPLCYPRLVAIKDDKFVFSCTEFCFECPLANVMIFDNLTKGSKYYSTSSLSLALYTESLVCPRNLLGVA